MAYEIMQIAAIVAINGAAWAFIIRKLFEGE